MKKTIIFIILGFFSISILSAQQQQALLYKYCNFSIGGDKYSIGIESCQLTEFHKTTHSNGQWSTGTTIVPLKELDPYSIEITTGEPRGIYIATRNKTNLLENKLRYSNSSYNEDNIQNYVIFNYSKGAPAHKLIDEIRTLILSCQK